MAQQSDDAEDNASAIHRLRADGDESCSDLHEEILTSKPLLMALSVVVVMLAAGVIAALLMFIWLSFQKPDAANVIIPLIVAPIVTLLMSHGGKLYDAVKAKRAKTGEIKKP